MPRYQALVTEVREVQVRYTIEAEGIAEALDKAEIGDTESEIDLSTIGVQRRMVLAGDIEELGD